MYLLLCVPPEMLERQEQMRHMGAVLRKVGSVILILQVRKLRLSEVNDSSSGSLGLKSQGLKGSGIRDLLRQVSAKRL